MHVYVCAIVCMNVTVHVCAWCVCMCMHVYVVCVCVHVCGMCEYMRVYVHVCMWCMCAYVCSVCGICVHACVSV